jgi:hypothetical protein
MGLRNKQIKEEPDRSNVNKHVVGEGVGRRNRER